MNRLLLYALLVILSAPALTAPWLVGNPPTKRTDGSPFLTADIKGFTIYHEGVQRAAFDGTKLVWDMNGIDPSYSGNWTATVTDTWGQESAQSIPLALSFYPPEAMNQLSVRK